MKVPGLFSALQNGTRKMAKKELKQSPVTFDAVAHDYFVVGADFETTKYSGVTGILKGVVYPNEYDGVPEEVLARAAARGTRIHELCQATDCVATEPQEGDDRYQAEVDNYKSLKDTHGIKMIANEYLVSNDEWLVASSIDCVDDQYNLYDIKTTYALNEGYVSWQLSIYAYMFELQNPGLVAGKLYAIWLRGEEAKLVEVPRHSAEEVEHIIELWRAGETYEAPLPSGESLIKSVIEARREIAGLKAMISNIEAVLTPLEEQLQSDMEAKGTKSFTADDGTKVTYTPASTTKRLDSKKLESEQPDIYKQYVTETERKAMLRVTFSR